MDYKKPYDMVQASWKKVWNMKVTVRPILVEALGMTLKVLEKAGGIKKKKIWGRIVNIQTTGVGYYTQKSPRDLRRFAVAQTPVKAHKLKLVGKLSQEVKI